MKLITDSLTDKLLANGRALRAAIDKGDDALDFKPVVKLFTRDAQCRWLPTEIDPDDDLAFGLGLPIERDRHFEADKSISAYAADARDRGHIVT